MPELEERQRFEAGSLIEAVNPSSEEVKRLHNELRIEPRMLDDAMDITEAPRLEVSHDINYVFVRSPIEDEDGMISTTPVMIAISETFVLVASRAKLAWINELANAQEELTTTQKTRMALQILQRSNSEYSRVLQGINRKINELSFRARKESIDNKEIMSFISFEETLNEFMNSLIPQNTVFHKLLEGGSLDLYNEDKGLIEALILGSQEIIDLSKASLKTSMNIRDAYSTVLTNSLNRVIKFFTSLTIILTVAVIVPSFYGMNVKLPLQENPSAFWIIGGATAIISFLLIWVFNKKKWL